MTATAYRYLVGVHHGPAHGWLYLREAGIRDEWTPSLRYASQWSARGYALRAARRTYNAQVLRHNLDTNHVEVSA